MLPFALAVGLTLPAQAIGAGISGTLVELHGDRQGGPQGPPMFMLRSASGLHRLEDSQPAALIGQRVAISDADPQRDGIQGSVHAATVQRVLAAARPGPQSVLVILLTTPDSPTPSATQDEARADVFTSDLSVNALYGLQSNGTTSLTGLDRADGDVVGPLSIPVSLTGCDGLFTVAAAADAAAQAAGFAPAAYDHVLYALPFTPGCMFGGFGELPGHRVWINGSLTVGVISHELGHNLGAHHANSLPCTSDGIPVALSDTCSSTEYGDPFDFMGLTSHEMSSWHRAQIGELAPGQQLGLTQSATVALASSDALGSPGPRLLLVPRKDPRLPVTSWFALEIRSPLAPFDEFAAGDPVTTGVTVRIVPALDVMTQSQLVDTQPQTPDFGDAPLQPGQQLTDVAHAITIAVRSAALGQASVAVTMPTLVDDVAPTGPAEVSGSGDTRGVQLSWSAGSDDVAVDHYDIERDGLVIGTTPGLTFADAGVAALSAPVYRVVAVDTSANRGASDPLALTLADATPPGEIPGLTAAVTAGAVRLSWAAAHDNRAVAGYDIRRDGVPLASIGPNVLSYSDQPRPGSHSYAVSARDGAGNIGPAAVAAVVTASSTPPTKLSQRRRAPAIHLQSKRRHAGVLTLRFSAAGATLMRAYAGKRRLAVRKANRLTVRVHVSKRQRRRGVRVLASGPGGTSSRTVAVTY